MHPYEQQLGRARRYYKRFKEIDDGVTPPKYSAAHYTDDIYAFFLVCYHIKDYLKNDPAFTKHTKKKIEDYITNTPVLALCADICNGIKHLATSSKHGPRSGSNPKVGRRSIEVHVRQSLSGPDPPQTLKINMEVEHKGQKLDAFQIATEAMKAWEAFVK